MTETIQYLDHFTKATQEICIGCSAKGATYRFLIPIPKCLIAGREQVTSTPQTSLSAGRAGIDTSRIPSECPNGYGKRPLTFQKIS